MFAALNYVFPSGKSKFTPPFINHPLRYCVFFPIQASRYLSYLVYPLCISGAIFSMFYLRQQRWRLQIWDLQALMPLIMSVQMETDHCKRPNVFFFPSQLLLLVDQQPCDWWVHLHAHVVVTQTQFLKHLHCVCDMFPDWPLLWPLASSQEFMLLASCQWRLSSFSITRSVLRHMWIFQTL